MLIEIDSSGVSLRHPDEFGQFHVTAADDDDVDRALRDAGWGTSDDGREALIAIDALRRAAGEVDSAWEEQFAEMLRYAASKGWTSEDGSFIKAHVERTG